MYARAAMSNGMGRNVPYPNRMTIPAEPLLSVDNLHTSFFTQDGTVKAVQETSFAVRRGEILGIVGESGCGKTTAGLSVMGLVPYPGRVVDGRISFRGTDLDEMDEDDRRILRGEAMAMIFQDPQAALNPLITIGDQIAEIFNAHGRIDADEVREETLVALASLGLPGPRARHAKLSVGDERRHVPAGDAGDGCLCWNRSCSSRTSQHPRST